MLKASLKEARQSIAQKDFQAAANHARRALEEDERSYNAYIFLGLAETNLKSYEEARQAYSKAIELDDSNLLAWQGYLTLFEATVEMSKYLDTASKVAELLLAAEENDKALKVILKAVDLAREKGTPNEIAHALKLILPISPFFKVFQDQLPDAAGTYVELSKIIESEEKKSISAAIAKGRSRLGVKLAELTRQVKADVYTKSELEAIYGEIINWTHDDEIRRNAEKSLLQHSVETLASSAVQSQQSAKVRSLAQGMTVINVKDDLAWRIALDWHDLTPDTIPLDKIVTYLRLYPNKSSSGAMWNYLKSPCSGLLDELARFLDKEDSKEDLSLEELALSLTGACEEEGDETPIICVAMTLKVLVQLKDWENVTTWCAIFLRRIELLQSETGDEFPASHCFHSFMLATALTFHRQPRYHSKAIELLDFALKTNPESPVEAQIRLAKARLLRLSQDAEKALDLLNGLDAPDVQIERAICQVSLGHHDEALTILSSLEDSDDPTLSREAKAIVCHQKGLTLRSLGAPRSEYFASFIQSLRYDSRYAPSYTVLGQIYKYEIKDARRAEKCFHEAFELSCTETQAAQELASGYADVEEWDLVEIIVQRVLQGNERLREPWCHRALGFVQLHFERQADAVASFQAALRLSHQDSDSWTGLGEAYLAMGRFQAAEKSFLRAIDARPVDWHPKYLLAKVQLALKEFEGCCQIMTELCSTESRPEFDTFFATALLGWADALLTVGWLSQATEKLIDCISRVAAVLPQRSSPGLVNVLGEAALRLAGLVTRASVPSIDLTLISNLAESMSALHVSDLAPEESNQEDQTKSQLCRIGIQAFAQGLYDDTLSDSQKAVIWCNIGRIFRVMHEDESASPWFGPGVQAFQCAVKLEPGMDTFWSALGVTISQTEPKLAHHCLVRASELSPKSAIHFANLGHFYLGIDQVEQAAAAFAIAQTLDATIALPWYGQSRVAQLLGEKEADDLAAHASTLVPQRLKAVDMSFAASTLRTESPEPALIQRAAWHARRLAQSETEPAIRCTAALLEERTLETPTLELLATAQQLAESMEALYESSESDLALQRYCDAKALLGRLQLRLGQFSDAIETCEMILELEPSNAPESLLSCTLVTAVAQAKLGNEAEAQEIIEECLQRDPSEKTFILLIQALWQVEDAQAKVLAHLQSRTGSLEVSNLRLAVSVQQGKRGIEPGALNTAACRDDEAAKRTQLLELALTQMLGRDHASLLKSHAMRRPWQPETWLRLHAAEDSGLQAKRLQDRAMLSAAKISAHKESEVALHSDDRIARIRALRMLPLQS